MNIQILIVGIQGMWSWEACPYTASVSIRGVISASPHQTFSLGVLGFQIQRSFPLALGDQSHRKLQLVPNFVYSFLEAAITNHPKPGGLKQQGCIISQFWGPEVWDHRHWARTRMQAAQCTLQRGESILYLLYSPPILEGNLFCTSSSLWWLSAAVSQLRLCHSSLCFHLHSTFSSSVSLSYKDPCDCI